MKKLFSVLVLTVATMATYSVSAQSLLGTWVSSEEIMDDGITVSMAVEFNSGNSGVLAMKIYGEATEEDFSWAITAHAGVEFEWTRNGNGIGITCGDNYEQEVKKVTISSGDPQIDALLEEYKGEIGRAFLQELEPVLRSELCNTNYMWRIKSLTSRTLTIQDGTDEITFTRVE